MAFALVGPLVLKEIRDGKPVFDLPPAAAPRTVPAPARAVPAVQSVAAAPVPGHQPNQYPGQCTECLTRVEAAAGERLRVNGKWATRHLPGDKKCVKAAPKAAEPKVPEGPNRPICTPSRMQPLIGTFTAEFDGNPKDYVTLKLKRQRPDHKFKPGQILVSRLGADNRYEAVGDVDAQGRCWIWPRFRRDDRLRRAIATVLGAQIEAGRAWARRSKRCWKCSIPLTTPASLARLTGDECDRQVNGR